MLKTIKKLKNSGLKGRSGSGFPVWQKWQSFYDSKGSFKYIIANCAEGEPYNQKDFYILNNYCEEVIDGLKIALGFFKNSEAIIYLKKEYYDSLKNKIYRNTFNLPIRIIKKTGGYLAGEETSLINSLENNKIEPKNKPPYPVEQGLNKFPTLINNVETFYYISKIFQNMYDHKRFYSIEGQNRGVFELGENDTIKDILNQTDNWPEEDFFIISGGFLSGELLLKNELEKPLEGIGSIVVFKKSQTNFETVFKKIVSILLKENCDKCIPCREGLYRINEILDSDSSKNNNLKDILYSMKYSSFCPLGKRAGYLLESIIKKIL
jgi:NADH:ubiquinone oxidoreductase subunit F (NADH-binding)